MTLIASFPMDGGLNEDRPAILVPANTWTSGSNVRFSTGSQSAAQGAARRTNGYTTTWTTPAACGPQFVLNMDAFVGSTTPTNYRWYGGVTYGGTSARIGQQTGGVDSNVTPGGWAAAAPGRWTGGILNSLVAVLNDQAHSPIYWDSTGPAWATLPGWPPSGAAVDTLRALRPYREFLIGMGRFTPAVGYYPDTVFWSDAAPAGLPPSTWVASATNQAGDAAIPGGGENVDGAVLGDEFIIYKQFSSYRMRYVGGNYVMAVAPLFKGWGAFSQNCIGEYGGRHYVFTGEDLIVHDGQRWESALYGKMRSKITGLDSTNAKNSWVWIDRNYRELWLGLVLSGQTYATAALVLDLDSGQCGYRTFQHPISTVMQDSQEGLTGTVSSAVMVYPGDGTASSGRFYEESTSTNTYAGTAVTSTVGRTHLDFGKPDKVKIVKWIRPWLTTSSSNTITVEADGRMLATSPSYTFSGTFSLATDDKVNVTNVQGRYLSFRFGSTANQSPHTISGFDVGYELRGDY